MTQDKWEKKFKKLGDECWYDWSDNTKPLKRFISQEIRKAQIEVLTDIFQTCYQEDSKTLELVEDKLSKLKDNKDEGNKHKK